MNELLPIDDGVPTARPARTRRHDVKVPNDDDAIEANDIQDVWEGLMLSDLIHYNELVEPDDDPSEAETVALSQHVTLPVLDDREPAVVPMVAPGPPTPVQFVGRPLRPVHPLFAPGGTPPGPAELRQALRSLAEELIDHGRTLLDLSCRDEEPAGYVARVLDYRSSDVSGVAAKLGMLSRLFARLGMAGNGKGA